MHHFNQMVATFVPLVLQHKADEFFDRNSHKAILIGVCITHYAVSTHRVIGILNGESMVFQCCIPVPVIVPASCANVCVNES